MAGSSLKGLPPYRSCCKETVHRVPSRWPLPPCLPAICIVAPQLIATFADETRQVVQEVIGWYKRYRDILNSDIIHLRKPDARD